VQSPPEAAAAVMLQLLWRVPVLLLMGVAFCALC
jgi:hypothetical protein